MVRRLFREEPYACLLPLKTLTASWALTTGRCVDAAPQKLARLPRAVTRTHMGGHIALHAPIDSPPSV